MIGVIEHSVIRSYLSSVYGILVSSLMWFDSYPWCRTQAVPVDGQLSVGTPLTFGALQETALSMVLFILCTKP